MIHKKFYYISLELLDDVLRFKNLDNHKVTTKEGKQIQKWRVLVTDKLTVRIVSSCLNMHELCDYGVTRKFMSLNCENIK